jgi:clan AA aspartic protease (TIGR02281 family)
MRSPIGIPLVLKNVKLTGPAGSISVDMILDTGAGISAVNWLHLKIIGYDPAVVEEREEIVTANGIIEVPRLKIEKISIGDIEATNVDVIGHDIPEMVGIKGLLGLSFIKNFRTVIDFKEGFLEIS